MFFRKRDTQKSPIPVLILASPEHVAEAEKNIKEDGINVKPIGISSPSSALDMIVTQQQHIVALVVDCPSLPSTDEYAAQMEELILKAQIKGIQVIHIKCEYTFSPALNVNTIMISSALDMQDAVSTLSLLVKDMKITSANTAIVRKIVGFVSTKGGVGTTTSAIALSYFISRGGFSTVLVDASSTKGNVTRYLYWSGLADDSIDSEETVRINNLLLFDDSILEKEYEENLRIQISHLQQIEKNLYVVGGIADPKDIEHTENDKYIESTKKLLTVLHQYFDFVIMDLGNNINSIFVKAINELDGYFVFTSAPRIAAVDDTIDSVLSLHPKHGFVLVSANSASDELSPDEAVAAIKNRVKILEPGSIVFLPVVPLDKGINLGRPMKARTLKDRLNPATTKVFKNIAKTVVIAVSKK